VIAHEIEDDLIISHRGDHFPLLDDPESLQVGIVVIGRNEGQRLVDCLTSLAAHQRRTVYVDSGSTDGSPSAAAQLIDVVLQLDMSIPFTAARARNVGFDALIERWPDTKFVQFVDGDCLLDAQWLKISTAFLAEHENVGLVFGRRRERYPDGTIYNALCDREWDGPAGQVQECGGDILIRAFALQEVGGYSNDLIAGEEPELCVRLREKGWLIWRVAHEMTLHDANITRFDQWWRRSRRSGHAYAEVSWIHRKSAFGIWKRGVSRAVFWGALLPFSAIAGAAIHPTALSMLLLYPFQIVRLALRQGGGADGRWRNAIFDVLGKFPEMQGVFQFYLNQILKRRQSIIEYK
jgi:GT2 family glycosyltransferase